jgi:xanthine/uracil permease
VTSSSEHHSASLGAWAAVFLIVTGFTIGVFALIVNSIPLWIATGVALALGGIFAMASKIMEQAY